MGKATSREGLALCAGKGRFARGVVAIALLVLALGAGLEAERVVRRDLLVAAAASLSGLAPQLTRAVHDARGLDVRFTFGGSNTLARQIIEGLQVDVFISADEAQMNAVKRAGRVVPGTKIDLLTNQLVIVAPASGARLVSTPADLRDSRVSRVAMGDPAAVPAGVYGRQWLDSLALWRAVAPKVVPLPSSPAALAAVREGRAQAGIVYRTDVTSSSGVRIVHAVPFDEAPRIVYPAAVIVGGREADARAFLAFLQDAATARLFTAAGFGVVTAH